MISANFVPAHRRQRSECRTRLRLWAGGLVLYMLLVGFGCALCISLQAGEDESIARKLDQLPPELEAARRSLGSLRTQLAEAQARLDAARVIVNQPDWTVLLKLVAQSLGDDIFLTSCRLQSADETDSSQPAARMNTSSAALAPHTTAAGRGERFTLTLSGIGQSHSSVSQFVLRLERIGIFERVTLLKTSRQAFRDQESTGFQVEAVLTGTGSAGVYGSGGTLR